MICSCFFLRIYNYVVDQAAKPKTITGFQMHTTPGIAMFVRPIFLLFIPNKWNCNSMNSTKTFDFSFSSQSVDVVGQAGKPKTITGFQTHTTPVLLAYGEKAELATDECILYQSVANWQYYITWLCCWYFCYCFFFFLPACAREQNVLRSTWVNLTTG